MALVRANLCDCQYCMLGGKIRRLATCDWPHVPWFLKCCFGNPSRSPQERPQTKGGHARRFGFATKTVILTRGVHGWAPQGQGLAWTNANRLYLMKLESFEFTDEAEYRSSNFASAMGSSRGWAGVISMLILYAPYAALCSQTGCYLIAMMHPSPPQPYRSLVAVQHQAPSKQPTLATLSGPFQQLAA